jgi:hypothetical protein
MGLRGTIVSKGLILIAFSPQHDSFSSLAKNLEQYSEKLSIKTNRIYDLNTVIVLNYVFLFSP